MQEKVKLFIIKNWHYIIFALLSAILPWIWLAGNFLMVTEERAFINYQVLASTSLYSWISGGYGAPAAIWNHAAVIPNAFIYYILSCLGFSNYLIQKVFISLILFLIFFSAVQAIKIFTKNKAILMTSVFFYAFSFYSTSIYFYTARMFQMILLPLFFAYLFKYLKTEKYKYAVYNFLALFFLQAIFCNLPQLVATFIVYLMAVSYFILVSKINFFYFLKKYFLKLASFFALLLPIFLYHTLISYFSFIASGGGFEAIKKIATFKAIGSKLSLLFQLRGSWWEYLGWQGITYNHWASFYDSKIIIICLYIIVATVFVSLLYRKRKRKEELFFYITFIVFIALASGSSFCPSIYNWLFGHLPFFAIFREPWAKFVPLFLINLAILLVLALEKIKTKLVVCLVLMCVVIQAYPFFSFNFFDHSNVGWKRILITPPQYWYEYMAWTKNNKNKTILSYPVYQDSIDYLRYNWYPANLGNANRDALVYNFFSYAQNVNLDMADMNGKYKNITKVFKEDYNNNFIKLGTIDYILYQKDLDNLQMRILDEKQSGLKSYFQDEPSMAFGDKLFLHKIKPEYFLPHIYAANNLITANDLASIAKIVAQPNYQLFSAIYLKDQNSDLLKTIKSQNQYNLFENKNDKINKIILTGAGNYDLYKKITLNSIINIKYLADKEKIIMETFPVSGIAINDLNINEEPRIYNEIDGQLGNLLQLNDKFISINKAFSLQLKLADIPDQIKLYLVSRFANGSIELENNSFENGLWADKVFDCSMDMPGEPQQSMKLSKDAADGEKSLELSTANHIACTSKSFLVKMSKNKTYMFSFDFKRAKSGLGKYYLVLSGQKEDYEFSDLIAGVDGAWINNQVIIKPSEDINKMTLFFYALADTGEAINRFDNIKMGEVELKEDKIYNISKNNFLETFIIQNINLNKGENIIKYESGLQNKETLPEDALNYHLSSIGDYKIKTPIIEYKKINPTKYQVQARGAIGIFPLIFAESFHDGWKAYLAKSNDNLSKGYIWDTWFRKPIDDNNNHLMVNGYANSWDIDPSEICLNNVKCVRNSDGSYDFDVIIEYWPQRLFYAGLFVSGAALFSCLCYLGWDFARSRKRSIIKKIPKIKIKNKI